MKHIKRLVLIGISLAVVGCSMKEAPLHLYTLESPHSIHPVSSSKYALQSIEVAYPEALKERIDAKMHFSYSDSQEGTYQNSQWSNDIGKLIQGTVMQSLDESRLFKGVVSHVSSADAEYRLESTVFAFSHRVRGSESKAVVSIQFALVSSKTGKLVKSKRFSYAEPTLTTNAAGYAAASNKAMERLSNDLIVWLK